MESAASAAPTAGFVFNHTVRRGGRAVTAMFRIRDPAVSLDFYTRVFGMTVLHEMRMEAGKFTNYFLAYVKKDDIPTDPAALHQFMTSQPGVLELCHNWGTETDPNFAGYHNGNKEPRGFGHICVSVPDIDAACARFESLGVKFQKRPNDGMMKGIAFVLDPDGYWIEILQPNRKFSL